MAAWAYHRGVGSGAFVLCLAGFVGSSLSAVAAPWHVSPLWSQFEAAAEPAVPNRPASSEKLTPAQLRERATAAEQTGDWEAAFTAYCDLNVADRSAPGVRDKLNTALRRVQQLRRHRDPVFLQYVSTLPTADAVSLFVEVTAKVPALFADPGRATPQQLWANGVEELDRALANSAFRDAFLSPTEAEKVRAFRASLLTYWKKRVVADPREARAALKQLVAAAQDTFPVRVPAALAVEVVCGACSGLDEYTVFLHPTQTTDPTDAASDLSAQGLYLGFQGGGLVVEGVAPGSWVAFHTPLRKGDQIARVNGRPMDMGSPAALADALRSPISGFHEFELVVPTPGAFGMARVPVVTPTVYGDHIIEQVEGIGYVRIGEFHATTPRELADALVRLRAQAVGLRALVLDLRGNRGGSFLAGVDVARQFLPAGLIVTTQGQLGDVAGRVFSSDSGRDALTIPLVVLIDADTASAAEVVAAALRDNNRAMLVGMPTFGKGTIQYPLKLAAADDADPMGKPRGKSGTVRLTIARLIAPRGAAINGTGVAPSPGMVESDPTRQLELAIERAIEQLDNYPMPPLPPN